MRMLKLILKKLQLRDIEFQSHKIIRLLFDLGKQCSGYRYFDLLVANAKNEKRNTPFKS